MGTFKSISINDQFFTSHETVSHIVDLIHQRYGFANFDTIVEPSCGNGSFIRNLTWHPNLIGIELDEKLAAQTNAICHDFLTISLPKQGKTLVIGNPPYGSRGAIATKFIQKSAAIGADVIAFVLPRSFMRDTLQARIPPFYHLVHEEPCHNFVLPNGEPHIVNSVFQIWELKDNSRATKIKHTSHPDFQMRHIHFSLETQDTIKQIQGSHAFGVGKSTLKVLPSAQFSAGSVWFIQPNVPGVFERFQQMKFEAAKNTTRIPSLSKTEIIEEYDYILNMK